MKVFISWAGERSNAIAAALYKWLPAMQQKIEPYMSSESIEKGTLWFPDLTRELEATRFGIVVLTSENKDSPWLHFEAGVVARAVDQARLAPILFGLNPSDIGPPLTQFQVTKFEKADMKKAPDIGQFLCRRGVYYRRDARYRVRDCMAASHT